MIRTGARGVPKPISTSGQTQMNSTWGSRRLTNLSCTTSPLYRQGSNPMHLLITIFGFGKVINAISHRTTRRSRTCHLQLGLAAHVHWIGTPHLPHPQPKLQRIRRNAEAKGWSFSCQLPAVVPQSELPSTTRWMRSSAAHATLAVASGSFANHPIAPDGRRGSGLHEVWRSCEPYPS